MSEVVPTIDLGEQQEALRAITDQETFDLIVAGFNAARDNHPDAGTLPSTAEAGKVDPRDVGGLTMHVTTGASYINKK